MIVKFVLIEKYPWSSDREILEVEAERKKASDEVKKKSKKGGKGNASKQTDQGTGN